MSEYAKNIQTIEDMWKKRIELRDGGERMSEYIYASNGEPLANERGEISLARAGEIVRCRDCKHYDPNDEPSEVFPDRYWCDRLTVYMPPDGFCSFGERHEP